MGRGMNGSAALGVMLGEMRSDIKWIVHNLGEIKEDHGSRIEALERRPERAQPRRRLPSWRTIRFLAAVLLTLTAAATKIDPKWVAAAWSSMR